MKKFALVCVLLIVGGISFLAMPMESLPFWSFLCLLIVSKGVAVLCVYLASKVFQNARKRAKGGCRQTR